MRSIFMENLLKYIHNNSTIIWKCWISTKSSDLEWANKHQLYSLKMVRLLGTTSILQNTRNVGCVCVRIFARAYNLVVLLMFRSYFANLFDFKGKLMEPTKECCSRRKPYNCEYSINSVHVALSVKGYILNTSQCWILHILMFIPSNRNEKIRLHPTLYAVCCQNKAI